MGAARAEEVDNTSSDYMRGRVDCMAGNDHAPQGADYDAGYAYQYELEQKEQGNVN